MCCPGVNREISLLFFMVSPNQSLAIYVATIHYGSPLLFLFRWLNTALLLMAPYPLGICFNLMLLLVWILSSLVCNFQSQSIWGRKLLLMCILCISFCFALFSLFTSWCISWQRAENLEKVHSQCLGCHLKQSDFFLQFYSIRVLLISLRFEACWPV